MDFDSFIYQGGETCFSRPGLKSPKCLNKAADMINSNIRESKGFRFAGLFRLRPGSLPRIPFPGISDGQILFQNTGHTMSILSASALSAWVSLLPGYLITGARAYRRGVPCPVVEDHHWGASLPPCRDRRNIHLGVFIIRFSSWLVCCFLKDSYNRPCALMDAAKRLFLNRDRPPALFLRSAAPYGSPVQPRQDVFRNPSQRDDLSWISGVALVSARICSAPTNSIDCFATSSWCRPDPRYDQTYPTAGFEAMPLVNRSAALTRQQI